MSFINRKHAGEMLAKSLAKYKDTDAMVAALPRGGVPIAAIISQKLNLNLEVLVVRKIGAPFQPELAVGAICEDQEPIWNMRVLSMVGLQPDDLGQTVQSEMANIKQQVKVFREGKKISDLINKNIILVDDGLATGATMLAAIKFLKKKGAHKITIAVPVAATSSVKQLKDKVDELVVLESHEDLSSVGQWYKDFSQVTNEQVLKILHNHP